MPVNSQLVREVDEQTSESFTDRIGLDERYEIVTMEPVSGYGPIVDAWIGMQYPLNVDDDGTTGVIPAKGHRHAQQFPDGSGVYESKAGAALYAIRTTDGTVVWNEQKGRDPYPYRSDAEADVEFQVPFRFVGEVLTRQTDLDITDEHSALAIGRSEETSVDGEVFMRGVVRVDVLDGEEDGVLIEHSNGAQVYVGYDSTAHRRQEMFGFVPFDGSAGTRVPTARDALDLLRPDDALGDETRQGEWFFADAAGDPKGTIQRPGVGERPYGGSPMDNHVPREWKTRVHDIDFIAAVNNHLAKQGVEEPAIGSPQDVFDAINDGEIDEGVLSYEKARELAGGIYVRGSVRHRENDHRMETIDEWKQPTTHDFDVITQDGDTYHRD